MVDERVDSRIGNRSHDKVQRIAVKSLRKGGEFPCAHMSSEKEHAFASASGGFEIFVAIKNNNALYIGACVFWKLRKFACHPTDLLDHV